MKHPIFNPIKEYHTQKKNEKQKLQIINNDNNNNTVSANNENETKNDDSGISTQRVDDEKNEELQSDGNDKRNQ